ncbi:hypothetical protein BJX61DRAFT_545536 [Aspergillus egyptiacus]|nr:hypothetical protein BJX61DRAFT_545536 [Aspergillus egyptiacus]
MKSFSSSVINKSGKKFAPKAPVRRAAAAAPPRAPSRRPSVATQVSASQPPPAASETATPEYIRPAPPSPTVEPPSSFGATVPELSAAPSLDHAAKNQATVIPIPQPKRKASFSAPAPRPTKDVLASSQTSQATVATAPDPAAQAPGQKDSVVEADGLITSAVLYDEPRPLSPETQDEEVAPEVRPSKRPRTTIEATSSAQQPFEEAAQLVTPPATQTEPATDGELAQSRDESESQSVGLRNGSVAKAGGRRSSRSTSNDLGKPKKERKRRARKREPTPEGAELIEIAPSVVKMSDLCKDTRTGKRSKRETELRAHELAEAERKRAQQEGSVDQTPVKETPSEPSTAEEDRNKLNKKSQGGPVMRIVNGEIVLDTASLQVDRHADAERNVGELEDVVENSLTRKINQSTYGKRSKTESWDEDMTDLFYRGLRIFGTDFMLISKMFPGRSRRQIKLKFNNEERRDPLRIKEALLGPRETIDINTYSEMTNTVYDDPRIIEQELEEEKRRIEEQHERDKKAQEDLLRNPDGLDGNNASGPDKGAAKAKRVNKKQLARDMGGGTEEILGSLDD